jgi:hypothetical protein
MTRFELFGVDPITLLCRYVYLVVFLLLSCPLAVYLSTVNGWW